MDPRTHTTDAMEPVQTPSKPRIFMIMTSLWLGTLLVALDTMIISVAVPRISSDFHALDQISWYTAGYLLTLTAFQPAVANIYRLFSVRVTYTISILTFEVGSIICASAPSSPIFIFGRAIAGVGAAGVLQGGLTTITFVSTLEQRPLRIAIIISTFGLATCLAPAIGGVMTDSIGWRWCFWINGPIGAVAFVVAVLSIRVTRPKNATSHLTTMQKIRSFDFLGVIFLMTSICCLLLALQFGGVIYPWSSSQVIGLLVGCVAILFPFSIVQVKWGERATLPVRLLRQRVIVVGCLFVLFVLTSSYVKNYFLPFYFQAVQNVSVTISGVRFMAIAVAQIFAVIFTGYLVSKTGYFVPFMVLGQLVEIAGTYMLSRFDTQTSDVYWASTLCLTGLGLGMSQQIPYTAIQTMLSEEDTIVGNALFTMFGQLGGAMAITIGSSILNNGIRLYTPQYTDQVSPQAVVDAGPSNIDKLSPSDLVRESVRHAWARTISDTMYFSLAAAAVGFFLAFLFQNVNLKEIAQQRAAAGSVEDSTDVLAVEERLSSEKT